MKRLPRIRPDAETLASRDRSDGPEQEDRTLTLRWGNRADHRLASGQLKEGDARRIADALFTDTPEPGTAGAQRGVA